MYEDQTFEAILDRVLARMPGTMDKRESSFLYNATAPIAVELQNMYIALDNILNMTFFDTADREGKYQRCKERGIDITQFDATKAIVELHVLPTSVEVPIGSRFNYTDVMFTVTEKIDDGIYYAECNTAGTIGNVTGTVTPVDYIDGLENSEIDSIYRWGEDEADESQIDVVFYSSLNSQAFGGNRADYIAKMKSLAGVGGVKVYTASEWHGGGTCKLVFTTSAYTQPTESFVDSVQEQIDPLQNQGAGYGIAPIGHIVTVSGVDKTVVNINMDITLQTGYIWEDVREYVENAVDDYFLSLNESWDSMENIIVRISQLETRILNIEGIIDITNVELNGEATNLSVDADSIVERGVINATT